MTNEKMTILYERLSREDERENESVSIENQKAFLENYAIKKGFVNYAHFTDDGWSGTRWDRPGFVQMMEYVERGEVGQILIKDMSRLGRDHLRVGLFLEQLREQNVRLIAVAENIDTAKGEDDFMPFRNIFAEWHARDTSRKIRAINDARTKDGKRVSGAIIYGYLHDTTDRQKWVLDEQAAPIVKRVFQGIIDGKTINKIADELTAEEVLVPAAHWAKIGAGMLGKPCAYPTRWSNATVKNILMREEYMGWKVLNKTKKDSYKSKKREDNPDKLIFKDAHPAIVDEEMWTVVQRLRETKRKPERYTGETNPLTGILFCADCGQKMYLKRGKTGKGKPHYEYVCSSYRHYSRTCTCHYIRVEVIESLILTAIQRTAGYVRENEGEFLERVRQVSAAQAEVAIKDSKRKLAKSTRRREEVKGLIKKLYEAYAADKIPENHFTELLTDYDTETVNLTAEIDRLQAEIDTFNADSVRADKFIELVNRYTEFTEFSATLLNEFIEKVIVHEAVKIDGVRTMQVDIHLNYIGKFEVPNIEVLEVKSPQPKGTKKLRRDMTEEERNRERERDKQRYAASQAQRRAAEQKRREEILSGTPYANAS